MLTRSARKSGQPPPDESPVVSPSGVPKRGRGGGRGRGRGKGYKAVDSAGGAVEEQNPDEAPQDDPPAFESASEDFANASCPGGAAAAAAAEDAPDPAAAAAAPNGEEPDRREESFNNSRPNSRGDERMREDGNDRRDDDRRRRPDRPDSRDRNMDNRYGGGRGRRSWSREEQYEDDFEDRRRLRGDNRGPPPPYRNHYGGGGPPPHDGYGGGYGRGGGGGGPPPPWGYGRGRGRGGGGFRGGGGGWRGRGDYGGPPPGHHPGMMGPPHGWDNGGYGDPMGGPPPHMMGHMRGPPLGHPHGPPHGHYGPPQGMVPPGAMPHHPGHHPGPPGPGGPQMMGGVPPPGMVPPPPPLPPGPPPPPVPTANEMENLKTEEEMAAMKEQITRQIEEAREKAKEGKGKEEEREEKEEEKSVEDKEKRKKQMSAMLRSAMHNKSTAAASSNKAAAAAAAAAPLPAAAAPAAPTTPSVSSAPQPVPPPSATSSLAAPAAVAAVAKVSPPIRRQETRDVFGREDEGGLFGERKATLSLPTAADRAEMQLYNDVLNAPHPSQDTASPCKGPARVPPPISTPAIVVSKPASDRKEDHSRERRSRSRSPAERGRRESRSPRRDRSADDSASPARRTPRGSSRSPRRSPRSSPRRGERERSRERGGRRSRSRSHGRHRSSRSRSKERSGRTRQDSGHYRRGGSPVRDQRSATAARRRGYELSPVRNSGGRSGHRSSRRAGSKSPSRRERSKSRERKRSSSRTRETRSTRRGREEEKEREERERRRKDSLRKDSTRSKENGDGSGDEGKENSTPGHDEEEIDRVMEKEDTIDEKSTVPADPVSIDEQKSAGVATVPAAEQPKPEPYEQITESIFHAQIKDRNDYGGECDCSDGECGVSCLLRYLTVECGRRCPSGDGCTNKRMQKTKGARVEVFHTGTNKGFGVRALEPVKKGGFIIEYIGEVVTAKAGEKRKKLYAKESPTRRHHYLMTVTDWQNRPFMIDATKYGNSSRFLNHSCEPNAFCDKWSVARRFRMAFFAKRNIAAGEEITFDYRFQNYGRQLIECQCGAPTCRGFLSSKEAAREEEERLKAGRDRSEESSSDEEEDEDEDEEEEEVEIREEDRKKLRKQQSILEEAERLLRKDLLTKKGQFELLSAIMTRLTPAHQPVRTRLVRLLAASGEKNMEAYRVFLQRNGRTILEKYLTLGVDEETTVSQYRELIPLMEALLELLDGIKRYTDTTRETSVMANLVPILRALSGQSEVPDGLVVFEVMHDIVSGIDEEPTEEEEEGEWTKRWERCTTRACELAETWKIAYGVISTFKIPKKREEKTEKRESEMMKVTVKPLPTAVSMIRPAAFSRAINSEAAGWQGSGEKKERRESRDYRNDSKDSYAKDRFPNDRSGYKKWGEEERGTGQKRKRDDDSVTNDRREYGGYRREEERRWEEREEKQEKGRREAHSATNSTESPRDEEEDAMQISPNLDDERERERERERAMGEPDAKRNCVPAYSPLPERPLSDNSMQHFNHHQQQAHRLQQSQHMQSGPPAVGQHGAQWGAAASQGSTPATPWGWNHPGGAAAAAAAAAGGATPHHWPTPAIPYGGFPNGLPPTTQGISYFNLAPAPGSSLTAELAFWLGGMKYCQHKAEEIQHRLDQASALELQQQGGALQHLQHAAAATETPLIAAATAAAAATPAVPREEKPARVPLNDRLAELTGVQLKSGGGGGVRTTPGGEEKRRKHSPPRPPYRPSDEEIAAAKSVRTKDGRLILISSIAKFCKVRTDTGAMYYYNKITRSPTWELPDGEEANSEDELEIGPSSGRQSAAGGSVSMESVGGVTSSASRSSTAAGKTPSRGRPQTPPEEPADPISSFEMDEKEKLRRKSEFKTRSGELLKRYVKASMFADVEEFKKTLRKIIHGCIDKEQKMNQRFDFSFSEDVKHRMVEYTKKYVQRHKLKPITYPDGIAD